MELWGRLIKLEIWHLESHPDKEKRKKKKRKEKEEPVNEER
jgi:hypothetical protein